MTEEINRRFFPLSVYKHWSHDIGMLPSFPCLPATPTTLIPDRSWAGLSSQICEKF